MSGDTTLGYFPYIRDSAVRRGRNYISPLPRAQTCGGEKCLYDSIVRAKFIDKNASIYSWPSQGGVIVLDGVEAINFEFLGLNPRDRPVDRFDNQAAQDALCQRLLLLGAKWWDSEAQCLAVAQLVVYGERVEGLSSVDAEPQPTRHEKNLRSGAHQRGGCGSPSSTRPLRA